MAGPPDVVEHPGEHFGAVAQEVGVVSGDDGLIRRRGPPAGLEAPSHLPGELPERTEDSGLRAAPELGRATVYVHRVSPSVPP
jgi:hypothetical protein